MIQGLNHDWEFTEDCSDAFIRGEDCAVTHVDIPHTSKLLPYNCFDESEYQMLSGYRKRLGIPEAFTGSRVFLNIGAAAHKAKVYVDGRLIAEHACGYTAFRVELTDYIAPGGDALVAISVDSREDLDVPPFGFVIDYMTYGGLYREAWLEVHEQSFIADVFAIPSCSDSCCRERAMASSKPCGLSYAAISVRSAS